MRDPRRRNDQWTTRRLLAAVWFTGLAMVIVAGVQPVQTGLIRLLIVTAVPVLWLLGSCLLLHIRWLGLSLLGLGFMAAVFAVMPGRAVDSSRLQPEYLARLSDYEGTRYIWGGENQLGIDCSGLVRQALVDAHVRHFVRTGNPRALRAGLDLWWHDCSAGALLASYRGYTTPLFQATAINAIDNKQMHPGDLAVTDDGVHVLAYLGSGQWIAADPGLARVATFPVPSDNVWFTCPVTVMRWTALEPPPA